MGEMIKMSHLQSSKRACTFRVSFKTLTLIFNGNRFDKMLSIEMFILKGLKHRLCSMDLVSVNREYFHNLFNPSMHCLNAICISIKGGILYGHFYLSVIIAC